MCDAGTWVALHPNAGFPSTHRGISAIHALDARPGETMIESTKSTTRKIWRWGLGMVSAAVLTGALIGAVDSAAADEAPTLPAYFTATNDPAKPAWPDPTGGASGTWAAPAGDGKGDAPS